MVIDKVRMTLFTSHALSRCLTVERARSIKRKGRTEEEEEKSEESEHCDDHSEEWGETRMMRREEGIE